MNPSFHNEEERERERRSAESKTITLCICIIYRYCQEVISISSDVVRIGLEEEKKRSKERELFQSAYQKALESNQQASSVMVQKYEEEKLKASRVRDLLLFTLFHFQLLNEHQIDTLGEKISKFHHDVMTLEMQLVDQLEVIHTNTHYSGYTYMHMCACTLECTILHVCYTLSLISLSTCTVFASCVLQ